MLKHEIHAHFMGHALQALIHERHTNWPTEKIALQACVVADVALEQFLMRWPDVRTDDIEIVEVKTPPPSVQVPVQVEVGQVWSEPDGTVRIIRESNFEELRDRIVMGGWTFKSDRPHGDSDFSYCCGSDWCRCMQ